MSEDSGTATLEVARAGALTTVQDLGRPGHAHLGVTRSGALDTPALRLANRLVGNPEDAACLETTVTGCTVRLPAGGTIAVTGAHADLRHDSSPAPWGLPVYVGPGATVTVGAARAGVRCYLAVAGGVAVAPVLGSRSTDTLAGLGPPPLRDGDVLPIGTPSGEPAAVDVAPYNPPADTVTVRIRLGPRDDWFTEASIGTLVRAAYTVSPTSNRVGARLSGPALERAVEGELPSEGLVCGAVQVPADGQPLVFLADHPTTGGYPVAAVLDEADLPAIAQARPGTTVRFTTARARRR